MQVDPVHTLITATADMLIAKSSMIFPWIKNPCPTNHCSRPQNNECGNVPSTQTYCEHSLVAELDIPPTSHLGHSSSHSVPFGGAEMYTGQCYKIVSSSATTVVRRCSDLTSDTHLCWQFLSTFFNSSTTVYCSVVANKPVLVSQPKYWRRALTTIA